MAIYLRGKPRDVQRCVRVTSLIYYAFNTVDLTDGTGVVEADLIAVGHKTLSQTPNGATAVFGMAAPKAAKFRKKIGTVPVLGTRSSCTTYGNGSSKTGIDAAKARGWTLSKPVRYANPRSTIKSVTVGVTLSTGIIYLQPVPRQDIANTEWVTALGLKLPATMTDADRKKAIRGTTEMAPARVTKYLENGSTVTLPCSHDKLDTAADLGFFPSNSAGIVVDQSEA